MWDMELCEMEREWRGNGGKESMCSVKKAVRPR